MLRHTSPLLLGSRRSPSAWLSSGVVDVRPGSLAHEVRPYPMAGTDVRANNNAALAKTRCLVATKGFVRGERVATITHENLLTGERAADVLRRLCRLEGSASSCAQPASPALPTFDSLVSAVQNCPGSTPLLVTRDSLLITLALYALRTRTVPPTDDTLTALWEWVACFPPRMPPLGTLAVQHFDGAHAFQPLQRKLSIGDVSQPLLPGENPATAATDLMVRAVEEGGLEALREPHVETVLTEEMRKNFYEGRRSALTARQHEELAARSLRNNASTTAQHLLLRESELDQHVLQPLAPLFYSMEATGTASPERADVHELGQSAAAERLRWAHFMMRSRAVNLHGGQQTSPEDALSVQVAVVPLLDMLNHTFTRPNVAFHYDSSEGRVIVSARCRIAAGEELSLHYGSATQRQCLFGDGPARKGGSAKDRVRHEVRQMEKRQRYELLDEDETEQTKQTATSAMMSSSLPTSQGTNERVTAEREAAKEVDWLWRFGFFRSKEEKAYEASNRWSSGLRRRIADLTDVRRKGRPGEFVVGVPEGLEHLRQQRERLERERYQRTKVFPPQQS